MHNMYDPMNMATHTPSKRHKSVGRGSSASGFELMAKVMKAVADPIRLAIVEQLRDGELCVCEIVEGVSAERSNVSRHLSVLATAGVVASRKEGLKVFYRLQTPCILNIFSCVRSVIEADLEESRQAMCCIK